MLCRPHSGAASSLAAHHDDRSKVQGPWGKRAAPGLARLGPTSPGPSVGRVHDSLFCLPSALPSLQDTTTLIVVVVHSPSISALPLSSGPSLTSPAWQPVHPRCPFLKPSSPFTTARSQPSSCLFSFNQSGGHWFRLRESPWVSAPCPGVPAGVDPCLETGYRGSRPSQAALCSRSDQPGAPQGTVPYPQCVPDTRRRPGGRVGC